MRTIVFIVLLLGGIFPAFAQMDTVYTTSGVLVGTVKSVGTDDIKFVYPNEDLENTLSQAIILRIVFKSGRIQTFAQTGTLKKVQSPDDWENVVITQVDAEIRGLYKLGDVGSKAKGTTQLSNQERVKQRAIRKLKIETAMMGGNVVYITNQRTQGNVTGGRFTSGQSAEASMTGVAYSNVIPDYEKFVNKAGNTKNFVVWSETKLYSSSSDMSYTDLGYGATIDKIYKEGYFIMVDATIQKVRQKTFRVTYFDDEYFTLQYRDKSSNYNLYLYWEN